MRKVGDTIPLPKKGAMKILRKQRRVQQVTRKIITKRIRFDLSYYNLGKKARLKNHIQHALSLKRSSFLNFSQPFK